MKIASTIIAVFVIIIFGCKSKDTTFKKNMARERAILRQVFVSNNLDPDAKNEISSHITAMDDATTHHTDGRISAVRLSNKDLTIVPAEIGLLTGLEELDLSGNKLTELPEEIGNLVKLRKLNVSENRLSRLPESIGKLVNLESLHIHSNAIEYLPSSFGRLTELNDLVLFNNKLSAFPDSLHGLEKLSFISLTGNMFTVFPKTLMQVPNLSSISADYGSIDTGSLPMGIRLEPDGFFVFKHR